MKIAVREKRPVYRHEPRHEPGATTTTLFVYSAFNILHGSPKRLTTVRRRHDTTTIEIVLGNVIPMTRSS